ncbi:MAG: peptidoglycan-binding domain-containing protein [Candidatus Nanopelagicales bacterium]
MRTTHPIRLSVAASLCVAAGWLTLAPAGLSGAVTRTSADSSAGARTAPRGLPATGKASARVAQPASPYVPQTSCDPVAKPGVVAFRDLVLATYRVGQDWGITRECTVGGVSEHKEGRAWDWGVDSTDPTQAAAARDLLRWLLAPGPDGAPGWQARRLGVMYIGWNKRIWGAYRAAEGWRPLPAGWNPHTDHVHFSFSWPGAVKATAWWTARPAAADYGPCPSYEGGPAPRRRAVGANHQPCPPAPPAPVAHGRLLWYGSSGGDVATLQARLGVSPQSGWYGPLTADAVAAWQAAHGLPRTGVVDARTRPGLLPAPPAAAGARPQATAGESPPSPQTRRLLVHRFGSKILRPGNRNKAVRAVQKLLVMPVAHRTGFFGPLTRAAVTAYQTQRGLVADAVVRPAMWELLRVAP